VKNIIGGKQAIAPAQPPKPQIKTKVSVPSNTSAAAQVALVTIDESSEGQRLDNFLLRILKGVPKTHVYRIIRAGEVRVNKGRAQADTRLALGDVVRVPPVRVSDKIAEKADKPAPARSFPILLEDDYLLAIDKPAGVAVHGGSGVSFGVIEQLRRARPEAKFLELVHRLDKETSGVLLIAKRRSALVHLQVQFKNRETGKTYLAVVKGLWPAKLKVIDLPLHKYIANGGEEDGERRVKVVAKDDPNGMRAITLVKVVQSLLLPGGQGSGIGTGKGAGKGTGISTGTEASLLEVTIKTGRTHQIRVHLASHGHPIVGDEKYGDFELNKQLAKLGHKRMYLHAWRLGFTHPASAQEITLESASPFTVTAKTA
jgi:23S rRNA pseudouridine955/2504/2580 synthase